MPRDLDGITLIDLAGLGPSARCVRALADLGARWIRLRPPAAANRLSSEWHSYGAFRGAEQFEFDLKHPGARALYLRLARMADIIVEGFRPGIADRLGIGYRDVSAVNQGIVYCAATGYGQTGPLSREVGHDINYQALGGGLALNGRGAEGLPAIPGMTLADSAGGGWHAALRVLAALVERSRTGRGKFLDVSAAEGVLQLMSLAVDQELATGQPAANYVTCGKYACYGIYMTADGKFLAVGAIETKFFANLCRVLGLEHLVDRQFQFDAQEELRRAIAEVFRTRARDEWIETFSGIEACLAPVLAINELAHHPQWQARGVFVEYTHPRAGRLCQVGPMGGGKDRGAASDVSDGACHQVLRSIGADDAEIDALIASGVVR
ncbi:MAG: CoA transferase [Gammaproteobacteria bacterium]|nr:MAG: CoA transferase [Gammaproteobacteria bacterium]